MDPAEISRRLKAARWLAGDIDEKGKVRALSTRDLAAREPLTVNRITTNRLEDIEQLALGPDGPRQMELEKIEEALELPGWFSAADVRAASAEAIRNAAATLGPLLLVASQAIRQAQALEPPDTDGLDLPGEDAEGGDG